MDWKKRASLGSFFLAIIALMFFSGFFAGKMFSGENKNEELEEIKQVLDKYYYGEVNYDDIDNGALVGAVSSLGDKYTYYYEKIEGKSDESYVGLGIGVSTEKEGFVISSIYKDSPCYKVGLQLGDVIYGINDKIYPTVSLDAVENEFAGKLGDVKTLHIKRDRRLFSVDVTMALVFTPSVESKMIGKIGYIKLNSFETNTYASFMEKLNAIEGNNIDGLIIDVRDNPGGLLSSVTSILREFLVGDEAFVYMENVKEDKIEQYKPTKTTKKAYDIKVLVNENSASAAEVFALAMNRVMNYDLIGKTTFGKGVYQVDYALQSKENTMLHITAGYWYGYNKESINKVGIEPTIDVSLPEYFDALPPVNETYNVLEADIEIKNMQLMLKTLGYNVRTDGYFDEEMKTVLKTNYDSETLSYGVMKEIYNDYRVEIVKDVHDAQLMKALSLLND